MIAVAVAGVAGPADRRLPTIVGVSRRFHPVVDAFFHPAPSPAGTPAGPPDTSDPDPGTAGAAGGGIGDGDGDGGFVERFVAGRACTGPWDRTTMHGGPPSALLVRAAERTARSVGAAGLVALRVAVDFLGPVPVGPVEVRARVLRPGRRITLVGSELLADGRPVLAARTWLLRTGSAGTGELPGPPAWPRRRRPPAPEQCPPTMTDWAFGYARAIEWRRVSGDPTGPGDAAAWARQRIPLVPGEVPSGLQRAVLVADSGNGISAALEWGQWSFVNVDLSVHLSRHVNGEWVLLDARSRYEPAGTGLATSVLSDLDGVVGVGAQTLLISRLERQG
ncbi:MAG TPA: thioesterase family protein [Kineosporiaceae bacterium]